MMRWTTTGGGSPGNLPWLGQQLSAAADNVSRLCRRQITLLFQRHNHQLASLFRSLNTGPKMPTTTRMKRMMTKV